MRKTIASLVAALALAAACGEPNLKVVDGEAPEAEESDPPITPSVDLEAVECGSDENGARAEGRLTNRSDERTAYRIVIEWYDRSGEYYTGATVDTPSVTPGGVATWEAWADTPEAMGGVCEVVEVYEVPAVEENAVAVPVDGR